MKNYVLFNKFREFFKITNIVVIYKGKKDLTDEMSLLSRVNNFCLNYLAYSTKLMFSYYNYLSFIYSGMLNKYNKQTEILLNRKYVSTPSQTQRDIFPLLQV